MIFYLKGKVTHKNDKSLVLENQGMGFRIFCSSKTLEKLKIGEEAKLYTSLHLKEETARLYGFSNHAELEVFEILNEISGIGPKTALVLASLGSLEKLKQIFEKEELPSEIKGIGKKKMGKILLELTGKIKEIKKPEVASDQALDALISLGFARQKAKAALEKVPKEIENTEERIKEALKLLGRK